MTSDSTIINTFLPPQFFFQNEADLAQELLLILQKLQQSASFFVHNRSFSMHPNNISPYGGIFMNNFVPTSFVPIQNLNPNPLQQKVKQSWLEDMISRNTGIPVEFLEKYPDSAREIALKYLKNLPEILFLRTSSKSSPKIISERSLYWMQIYGPAGSRLDYMEKCVSISMELIKRFKQSPYFAQVAPFDRNYRAIIPYVLQNTAFEMLSLPLVHSLSAYYHSRANPIDHSENSEQSSVSSLMDVVETQNDDVQMSDISEAASASENKEDDDNNFHGEEANETLEVVPNSQALPQEQDEDTNGCIN
jgi:hypothetical protein